MAPIRSSGLWLISSARFGIGEDLTAKPDVESAVPLMVIAGEWAQVANDTVGARLLAALRPQHEIFTTEIGAKARCAAASLPVPLIPTYPREHLSDRTEAPPPRSQARVTLFGWES